MEDHSGSAGSICIVEDDRVQCALLRGWLERAGYQVDVFSDGESCLTALPTRLPDMVCVDLHLPGLSGDEVLAQILEHYPGMAVVVLTGDTGVDRAVTAIKAGAFDYLVKPANRIEFVTTIRNAVAHSRMSLRLQQLERALRGTEYPGLVGESTVMRELFRQMGSVALTDVTVLIEGESGTGKELVARALHASSARRGGPLVTVNCAAIPESLQESELFGHEKGAFTGATTTRQGKFELATGGTLFLDEAGELSLAAQSKLLRVVQEGTFQRVGGTRELRSDFRLLAATHRNLQTDVSQGRFREDLFFRLAVFELYVPPLRARGDDVVLLAGHFAERHGVRLIQRPVTLSTEAADAVRAYDWPGNVRELDNAVQTAVVSCHEGVIRTRDLPPRVRSGPGIDAGVLARAWASGSERANGTPDEADHEPGPVTGVSAGAGVLGSPAHATGATQTLDDLERGAIVEALARASGNRSEASRLLGIGRTTLYEKLRRYGIT